jgi:hypothetical protein
MPAIKYRCKKGYTTRMGRAATTVMAALMLTGVTMLDARFCAIPMEPMAAALVDWLWLDWRYSISLY